MLLPSRGNERFLIDERRPLHGVPILLKDTFATLDSMDTTGAGFFSPHMALGIIPTLIKRLQAAHMRSPEHVHPSKQL